MLFTRDFLYNANLPSYRGGGGLVDSDLGPPLVSSRGPVFLSQPSHERGPARPKNCPRPAPDVAAFRNFRGGYGHGMVTARPCQAVGANIVRPFQGTATPSLGGHGHGMATARSFKTMEPKLVRRFRGGHNHNKAAHVDAFRGHGHGMAMVRPCKAMEATNCPTFPGPPRRPQHGCGSYPSSL